MIMLDLKQVQEKEIYKTALFRATKTEKNTNEIIDNTKINILHISLRIRKFEKHFVA